MCRPRLGREPRRPSRTGGLPRLGAPSSAPRPRRAGPGASKRLGENRAASLRTHSRLSFSSADRPLVTHLTGGGVSHSFQSAHSLLISFLLEDNLLQKKMQGWYRHSLNFSFLCFLLLPPPPDFLSLLFLSFSLPFLPSLCFLPCSSLLSSPHLFLSIPTSLFPHLYFSVSPPSVSVTSLGLSPRALRYSGSSETESRGRAPGADSHQVSKPSRGCRLKCPQDSSIEAFPPLPRTRFLCPQLPRNLQETPAHNAAHTVAYPLWGSSNPTPSNSSNSYPRGFPRF